MVTRSGTVRPLNSQVEGNGALFLHSLAKTMFNQSTNKAIDNNSCETTALPTYSAALRNPLPNHQKKKLWHIDAKYHCSLIGTCVSIADLRKIAKKCESTNLSQLGDFHLHSTFVNGAIKTDHHIRLLQKHLEKKYASVAQRFHTTKHETQSKLWRQAVKSGDAAGAYWALLTNPHTTQKLLEEALGDIHMMSHLNGASIRITQKQADEIRDHNRQLKEQLRCLEQSKEEQRHAVTHLSHKVNITNAKNRELQKICDRYRAGEPQAEITDLKNKKNRLARSLATLRLDNERNRAENLELRSTESALKSQIQHLRDQLRCAEREHGSMQALLITSLHNNSESNETDDQNPAIDLSGQSILYVGGQTGRQRFFRSLVERFNGHFHYHDGGLEDGSQRLESLLHRADVICCPIDSVSHEAVNRVKRHCKRLAKDCLLLRRSSLAAFSDALVQSQTDAQQSSTAN